MHVLKLKALWYITKDAIKVAIANCVFLNYPYIHNHRVSAVTEHAMAVDLFGAPVVYTECAKMPEYEVLDQMFDIVSCYKNKK